MSEAAFADILQASFRTQRFSKKSTIGHLDFLPFSCPLGGARGLKQEDERRLSLCCVRMGVALPAFTLGFFCLAA